MPSSVNTADYPLALDGGTYEANAWRTNLLGAVFLGTGTAQVTSGVLADGGALAVSAPGGMTVTVATGYCVIASSAGSTAGGYSLGLTTAAAGLTIATADPTNPRIDLVCMTVTDNGNATSVGKVQVITGTPAGSPVAPTLPNTAPNSSLALAYVAVAAGASTITAGNITDKRVFTGAAGGIIPVPSLTSVPSGYNGLYAHDLTTGRFVHDSAGGVKQPLLLPFAPVMAVASGNVTYSGSETTILTASVTTNGSTDIKITVKWPGMFINAGGGSTMSVAFKLYIDSTVIDSCNVQNMSNDNVSRGGGELTHYTNSALSDTPSNGTHTIKWSFVTTSGGTIVIGNPTSGPSNPTVNLKGPITLRVEPVNL